MIVRNISRTSHNLCKQFLIVKRMQHNDISKSQSSELTIDVPWGRIAGKHWGPKDKEPILAVHGFMDNAGTFDLLAPLLKNHSILAIDLPGHGLSSWLPPGMMYSSGIHLQTLRHIKDHFGLKNLKLMGHSMGAILCLNYAVLYPEEVKFLVNIDALANFPTKLPKYISQVAKDLEKYIKFEKKFAAPPTYTEEETLNLWMEKTIFKSLDRASTKTLMIRGTTKLENGRYFFNRDYRLMFKPFDPCYSDKDILELVKGVKCPIVLIKASGTKYPVPPEFLSAVVQVIEQNNPNFKIVQLEGLHHFHMITPQPVAQVIGAFLDEHN